MSRYSLTRALLLVLVGLLVWTTVAPAEAKRPRRYSDEILLDWTVCKNGGEFAISAGAGRAANEPVAVRLVVTSAMSGRVLLNRRVRLRYHRHTVWVLNDLPDAGVPVIANPDIDPRASDDGEGNHVTPDDRDQERNWTRTVRAFWWPPARGLVNIGLGPVDQPTPTFALYLVEDCLLLPGKRSHSFAALTSWLRYLTSFA
jgi:hypothetical protein